jgi:hypothetical protein
MGERPAEAARPLLPENAGTDLIFEFGATQETN